MDFADLVGDAGIEEDALGGRRFARVDMGADANIAVKLDTRLAGHGLFLAGNHYAKRQARPGVAAAGAMPRVVMG
jgi:hypothetical protein